MSLDPVLLSRIQFAITIGFHFIFPPITIGLAWLLVMVEALAWKKKDEVYLRMGKFFGKLLGLTFVLGVIGMTATGLFPRMVPSSVDLMNSLSIYNASSTPRTLKTMFIIALLGMPVVIVYTVYIYRVFRGKVDGILKSY